MSLQLRDVSVDYGATRAVDSVSVVVEPGTVLALVGPSGCGKSSLLRAIAGLVPLAAGTVSWNGTDLTSTPTEQRDLGFMFQDHALFTHRNVADNVAFGLRMQGVPAPARTARVDELLALVGLDGFGSRSVEGLSGGEAQRVALARALAPRPRILLLDEPLASLDRARRDELNDELASLLRDLDQTAIYVTHDQDEAFAIADEVGVEGAARRGDLANGRPCCEAVAFADAGARTLLIVAEEVDGVAIDVGDDLTEVALTEVEIVRSVFHRIVFHGVIFHGLFVLHGVIFHGFLVFHGLVIFHGFLFVFHSFFVAIDDFFDLVLDGGGSIGNIASTRCGQKTKGCEQHQ